MTDETSYDAAGHRRWLVRLRDDVRRAVEEGVDPELILDAVCQGIQSENRAIDWGGSPLSLTLTRAFNSAVGPMGGPGPTAVHTSSTAPATSRPAGDSRHPESVGLADLAGAVEDRVLHL